jgi:thiol-disulfide isomerase/thioredoxin
MTSPRRQRLSKTHSHEHESPSSRRNSALLCCVVALLASLLLLHRVLSNNERSGGKNSIEKGIRDAVNSTRSFKMRSSYFFSDAPRPYDSNYSRNSTLFMNLKASRDPQMTVFFSPWCHHCVHFVPEFVKLATAYERSYSSSDVSNTGRAKGKVTFATINCVEERETCQQEAIEFYPCVTVRHFPKGRRYLKIFMRLIVSSSECNFSVCGMRLIETHTA